MLLDIEANAKWLTGKYVNWDNLVQLQKVEDEFTENFDTSVSIST